MLEGKKIFITDYERIAWIARKEEFDRGLLKDCLDCTERRVLSRIIKGLLGLHGKKSWLVCIASV